jgi:multiple sugar transport system permease protein
MGGSSLDRQKEIMMKRKLFYKFSAPSNLTMVLLMIIPLGVAVYLSLHFVTFRNINTPEFVGLSNYTAILKDSQFWQAFRFSLTIVVIAVPIQIGLAFIIALLLDQIRSAMRGVYVALILLPFIVVPVVGTLIFKQLFEVGGLIAYLYRALFDAPFLFTPISVKVLVILHLIWNVTPYPTIVFFAGLQAMPDTQLEAAEVDGATPWQQLTLIVIPYLRPLLIMTTMILVMDMYRVFDSIMVMTEQNPMFQAENLMMYSYRIGMHVQRLGKANATAILTIFGVLFVLVPFLRITYLNQTGKD